MYLHMYNQVELSVRSGGAVVGGWRGAVVGAAADGDAGGARSLLVRARQRRRSRRQPQRGQPRRPMYVLTITS